MIRVIVISEDNSDSFKEKLEEVLNKYYSGDYYLWKQDFYVNTVNGKLVYTAIVVVVE